MACSSDLPEETAARYLNGLRSQDGQPAEGPPASPVSSTYGSPEPPVSERRRHPRYRCSGSAQLRKKTSTVHTWGTFTDISLGGCYIEMQATFPPDTEMELVLELNGARVEMQAVVRVTYPFLGMGLAFTGISDPERVHLEEMIATLAAPPISPQLGPRVERGSDSSGHEIVLPVIVDAASALNTLIKFFQKADRMTRGEFLDLIRQSQPFSLK
ncbi:MAG TPA: PilZ domain-containing protein [Terriglobales bacterium]|jgi:hypothetical protein